MVALALYGTIYLWDATNGSITELCNIASGSADDYYSSVSFMPTMSDSILALGNNLGDVQVMMIIMPFYHSTTTAIMTVNLCLTRQFFSSYWVP